MDNPKILVLRYRAAFYGGDRETMRTLLADDVHFIGPGATFRGADTFVKASAHVAPGVKEVKTHKVLADGSDVSVLCDLVLDHTVDTMSIAEWYRVDEGRIASIRVIFDMAPFVRKADTQDESAVDPVCHMSVDKSSAAATYVHDGTVYYFCNSGCARAFASEPLKYLGGVPG